MKHFSLFIMTALAAVYTTSATARHYGTAGCGLGSVWMGNDSQLFAATTNQASYNQLFGISSGTSNCTAENGTSAQNQLPLFVEANKIALSNDAARGQGETVLTLSQVLGCEDAAYLGETLQRNFKQIFENEAKVSDSILGLVKTDEKLSSNCKNII